MQPGCNPLCSVGMPDWDMCWPEGTGQPADTPDQPVDTGWPEGNSDCNQVLQGMFQLGKHCLPAV